MPTLRRRHSDPINGSGPPFARRWPTPPGRSRTASSGARLTSSAPWSRPIREEVELWGRPARAAALAGTIVLAGAGVAAGVIVSDPSGDGGQSGPDIVRVSPPPVADHPLGEGGRGDGRPGPPGIHPQLRRRAGRRRHQGRSRHRTAGVPDRRRSGDGRRGRARRRGRRPAAAPRWPARRRSRWRGSSPAPSSSMRPAATPPRSRPPSTRPPPPSSPRPCSSGRRVCPPT